MSLFEPADQNNFQEPCRALGQGQKRGWALGVRLAPWPVMLIIRFGVLSHNHKKKPPGRGRLYVGLNGEDGPIRSSLVLAEANIDFAKPAPTGTMQSRCRRADRPGAGCLLPERGPCHRPNNAGTNCSISRIARSDQLHAGNHSCSCARGRNRPDRSGHQNGNLGCAGPHRHGRPSNFRAATHAFPPRDVRTATNLAPRNGLFDPCTWLPHSVPGLNVDRR